MCSRLCAQPYHLWVGFDATGYVCDSELVTKVKGRFGSRSALVELAPELEMPERAYVEVRDWDGFDLDLELELVDRRYRCRELKMYQRPGGAEITGERLRSVPVATFMKNGVALIADLNPTVPLPEMAKNGPTDENLMWVAWLYRLAYAVGDSPKQAVASSFGLAQSTAGRWISRARDAKFLDAAKSPGRAGG